MLPELLPGALGGIRATTIVEDAAEDAAEGAAGGAGGIVRGGGWRATLAPHLRPYIYDAVVRVCVSAGPFLALTGRPVEV
jgi:hypothetical protein